MIRIEDIIEQVHTYNPKADEAFMRKAYLFSAKAHQGQTRASGEPYLTHPMEVAFILAEMRSDPVAIAAGLLHDVLEDTHSTPEELQKVFGPEVRHVVEAVTKMGMLSEHTGREGAQAATFRKMILGMTNDVRVILVKLADRLHNMRTLEVLPEEKRRRIARETLDVYAPIAHRLGMGRVKSELEDLSFRYAEAETFGAVERALEEKRRYSDDFIQRTADFLRDVLKQAQIKGQVSGRTKHIMSIWRKMQVQGIPIEEVYDYMAFRIVVQDVAQCYAVLGAIHGRWKPIPGRIKDYIAIPKPNGYQSLHTAVLGEDGHPFEVQIRTVQMHLQAEEGIASHWQYKEGHLVAGQEEEIRRTQWMRQLLEWHQEMRDPSDFYGAVKVDLEVGEIFVFTPRSEVKVLPRGATGLDFAYAIHTEVGHHTTAVKVNGRQVPLKTELATGDIVEVVTSPTQRPRRDWLRLVVSQRARSKIRAWVNQEEKDQARTTGEHLLDLELKRMGVTRRKLHGPHMKEALQAVGLPDLDSLHAAIGYGKILPGPFVKRLTGEGEEENKPAHPAVPAKPAGPREAIVVDGLGGLLTNLARCCGPIHGDDVVGFVTRGRGITIHKRSCANVAHLGRDHDRLMPISWGKMAPEGSRFQARLYIHTEDRKGILADIANAISGLDSNIVHFNARTTDGARGEIEIILSVRDLGHVDQLTRRIRSLDGILAVDRTR